MVWHRIGITIKCDTIQVVMDRRAASLMRSYPNLIPLDPRTIRAILSTLEPYPYDRVYGGWWRRNIGRGARASIAASADRYISVVTKGS